MNLKLLAQSKYQIVGVMVGNECAAELFLKDGEKSTLSARLGLVKFLEKVAEVGLNNVPSAWFHEVDKKHGIYEFIKGPLRLFFFKGQRGQIAVCTTGVRKSGQKVDKSSVSKAALMQAEYFAALNDNSVKVVCDDSQ